MKDALAKALDWLLLLAAGSFLGLMIVCALVGACVIAVLSLFSAMVYGGSKHP